MSDLQVSENGNHEASPSVPHEASVELRELLQVLVAVRNGDFSVRLPAHWTCLVGKIADAVNDVASANQNMAEQLERVGQVVGNEGKTRQRLRFPVQFGAWSE